MNGQMNFSEPLAGKHPWFVAALLGTVATPAGVVLGWLVPRPLDVVVAMPLVLVDMWAESRGITGAGGMPLLLLSVGVGLTWLFYIAAARLVLWRLLLPSQDRSSENQD